ncbi:DUF5991 domain-containing protein [Methylobacterium sp. J-090]|uniref:DUF5991 domain-containing protein n=1 Tax=Methylobacterium sp. J-090 TaxID=2836666 RepID=UPI001FB95B49|nr:DUF5991 domain-containing protein [Methylobacterium sp. J-090]MCJ2081238.1 DUF5991 domain-containing protein [Methylobacterium sp. J-090]
MPAVLAAPEPARSWAGTYVFEHSAGRTAGGSPIVVAYRLDLVPGRGTRDCLLRVEGFQTNETIVCKLRGDANSVSVDFHTYGDGRIVNAYGTKRYDVGAPLFSMERSGALVTRWQALTPDGVGAGTAMAAFQRQR